MPAELPAGVLSTEAIRLVQSASDKLDALHQSGRLLVEIGAVEPGYADAMFEREELVSTFVGEGVAIPHGTDAARALVRRTALGFIQYLDGVDWGDGLTVYVCIPIAASGSEHVKLLSALAMVLVDPERAARLRAATSAEEVLALIASGADEDDDEVDDGEH